MSNRTFPYAFVVAGIVAGAAFVGFSQSGKAVQPGQPPFRNPIEQREEMIHELREIKDLLKQQTELLRRMQKD